MNSVEIRDARAQLKQRALEIIDNCKKEVRDLTQEETDELETIKAQIKEKDEELRDLQERLDNLNFETEENEEVRNIDNNKSNITEKMNKRFSLLKAIRSIANNQPLDDVSMAVINAGKEEARKAGVNAQGQIQLPTEERAAVTVTAEGEDVVATELFDILTPLRARNVLVQAGAKFRTNLVGNGQYPTMTKSNVTWEGETSSASDGAPTFGHVTLSPKRITAYVDVSKMLIAQDSIGVENAIREDLIKAVNAKIEETVLGDAAGTTTKPEGIFKTIEPDTVADYAGICDKEADVEDANVYGDCVYIMSNKGKAQMPLVWFMRTVRLMEQKHSTQAMFLAHSMFTVTLATLQLVLGVVLTSQLTHTQRPLTDKSDWLSICMLMLQFSVRKHLLLVRLVNNQKT